MGYGKDDGIIGLVPNSCLVCGLWFVIAVPPMICWWTGYDVFNRFGGNQLTLTDQQKGGETHITKRADVLNTINTSI